MATTQTKKFRKSAFDKPQRGTIPDGVYNRCYLEVEGVGVLCAAVYSICDVIVSGGDLTVQYRDGQGRSKTDLVPAKSVARFYQYDN
jgi:hypothetical protein